MHNWSTFCARMSQGQTQTHKTHHGPDLGEAITITVIVFSMFRHESYTQMPFCPKTSELGVSKLGFLQLWRPIILCVDLHLKWGLKQSFSPCREPFNGMWHATCAKLNQGDSWLLMVGWRTPNSLQDSKVSPSTRQWKGEESRHVP